MNPLTGNFSLYETLRLVIPGIYITANELMLFQSLQEDNFLNGNTFVFSIIFITVSLIQGAFINALDIPKSINFFQKDLPTRRINEIHPRLDIEKITNTYFDFYDRLSIELKAKQEIYSGIYHFLINIASASILLSFVALFKCNEFVYLLNLLLIFVSVITGLLFYYRKIKRQFRRHLKLFLSSDHYNRLVGGNEKLG